MSETPEMRNIQPEDAIRKILESSWPSATDWVQYGLSAKEATQNAFDNFQRLPSAKDFMSGARSDSVSETPAPYNEQPSEKKRLSPQQRLEALEEIRWDLLIVGEQIRNPLHALEMLRAMGDKVKALMDDARAEIE